MFRSPRRRMALRPTATSISAVSAATSSEPAGTSTNEFYAITDRGPNGEAEVWGATRRTFPVPWFDPTILHVRASGPRMATLRAIPVVGGRDCSVPVGGLPNLGGTVTSPADGLAYDDPPYAYDAVRTLDYAQSGLDTEGLVRTPNGEFWFAEEYSPSIGRLDANGCVIERIVPNGLPLTNAGYPVVGDSPATEADRAIPAIYQLRKRNRGFEALALTSLGRYLYVGLQSPLLNPDHGRRERCLQHADPSLQLAAAGVRRRVRVPLSARG